ncbi:MAG: thioredoxin family protein [Syntrophales bacterium]
MKIEILGPGCAKCKKLAENVERAIKESKIEAEIVKVEEIKKIVEYGVMITPAMAVNGVVKSTGKILSVDEIKKIIT